MRRLPRNRVLAGDAHQVLTTLPESSADCVITSPPYFRLRNYQHPEQIGLEGHVDDWVHRLLDVTRQLKRVLKETGSFWLNLGDAYSRTATEGAPPKSLLLAPERLAMALTGDGWILRNKVVWAKTNPMPTSVRDRLSCTHEVLYFFVRSRTYYFDLDLIRIPHVSRTTRAHGRSAPWSIPPSWRGPSSGSNTGLAKLKAQGQVGHKLGKNPGDVWQLATAGYKGQHHAVFPERLVERPLLTTCPEKTCRRCGVPWSRQTVRRLGQLAVTGKVAPRCGCRAGSHPGVVLDPFIGSGTVGVVARKHHRDWLGIELNPAFVGLTKKRMTEASGREPPARAA